MPVKQDQLEPIEEVIKKSTKNKRPDVPEDCVTTELTVSEQRHMPEILSI